MKKTPFLFCTFLASFCLAQCSLEISDTSHINCNGDNTGAISLNVLNAAQPYTVNLSNGAVAHRIWWAVVWAHGPRACANTRARAAGRICLARWVCAVAPCL